VTAWSKPPAGRSVVAARDISFAAASHPTESADAHDQETVMSQTEDDVCTVAELAKRLKKEVVQ
jgi:hypothetical protein